MGDSLIMSPHRHPPPPRKKIPGSLWNSARIIIPSRLSYWICRLVIKHKVSALEFHLKGFGYLIYWESQVSLSGVPRTHEQIFAVLLLNVLAVKEAVFVAIGGQDAVKKLHLVGQFLVGGLLEEILNSSVETSTIMKISTRTNPSTRAVLGHALVSVHYNKLFFISRRDKEVLKREECWKNKLVGFRVVK